MRVTVASDDVHGLTGGWRVAGSAPGAYSAPPPEAALDWIAAAVPGTVAGALRDAELLTDASAAAIDERDWWFRVEFAGAPAAAGELVELELGGIATVAEVFLNGTRIAESGSMFVPLRVDVGAALASGVNRLDICCRALGPLLRVPRKPRARWRTRLVDSGLRFHRTMLLGRAPGFAPGPPAAGPWRPVRLVRHRGTAVRSVRLRPRLDGDVGVLAVEARVQGLGGNPVRAARAELRRGAQTARAELAVDGELISGEVNVTAPARWWPHTHGEPALYEVALEILTDAGTTSLSAGRTGFRSLATPADLERDGLALTINETSVFVRGAVWTPPDLLSPYTAPAAVDRTLAEVRAAGMNMLRIPGIGAPESGYFHDACDAGGVMIWQDFMFANLDYPESEPAFMSSVQAEAEALVEEIGGRPSLAVLCGGSEVAQQVAMLGLDPALASGPLFGELLPGVAERAGTDAAYVPSAPWGGDLPFRPGRGVANYYGVGAYRRPLSDARLAGVRFAAECLAFANVPDGAALEELAAQAPGGLVVHHPRWKQGVPRDAGAGWDFEDVRDHYLRELFGVEPAELRSVEHERYLELSRAVSGEVMAETFGEWRRAGSPCGGALILWLRDLVPGPGWGLLDSEGRPKEALHHLRRVLAPVAVWMTDEGLAGVDVHVANDGPGCLAAELRVCLYRDRELRVEEAVLDLKLAPHETRTLGLEAIIGRFVDASWAYRFGPPGHDLIVATLARADQLISQAFRFPAGRPRDREPADRLGVSGRIVQEGDAAFAELRSQRLVYGIRLDVPGFVPSDDAFSLEPGRARRIALRAVGPGKRPGSGTLTALNMAGRVRIAEQESE